LSFKSAPRGAVVPKASSINNKNSCNSDRPGKANAVRGETDSTSAG
jgi:hypothetical protein